jgi:hypothetical protein
LEQVDDAIGPEEMQGADDDEMPAAIVEHGLEERYPGPVAFGHERLVESREVVEVV